MSTRIDLKARTKTKQTVTRSEQDKVMISAIIDDMKEIITEGIDGKKPTITREPLINGSFTVQAYDMTEQGKFIQKDQAEIHIFAEGVLLFQGTLSELRDRLHPPVMMGGERITVPFGESYAPYIR
jgi:hypothetical protein